MPYYFSDENIGKNISPYLYLEKGSKKTQSRVTVLLPDIFSKIRKKTITQGPFSLAPNSKPPVLPYKINIPANSALWKFGKDSVRQNIANDFNQFIITMEKAGLKPGALNLVRQCLSQAIPATFAETLFFRYGLLSSPGRHYVDLLPGQRLRVDYQEYQMTGLPEIQVNGYVGSGSMYYEIAACRDVDENSIVGFSPFLNTLLTENPTRRNSGGAGGVIDLVCRNPKLQYWRLLYPKEIIASDDTGFVGIEKNITLVGSTTFADLEAATDSYFMGGKIDIPSTYATFFRGRALPVPEIMFYLRGSPQYVPLGTTVRQIINRHIQIGLNNNSIPNFKYQRSLLNYDPQSENRPNVRFPDYEPVNFSGQNYQSYWNGTDCFDLPILGGDALTFSIPDAF